MNILFFDVVPTNIVRFFKGIVDELSNLEDGIQYFFLLEENDHYDSSHVEESYTNAKSIGYVKNRKVNWFKNYLVSNKIDGVVTNAQRIPDDMVVLAANELCIPTFMFQHGMYIPFMKRNLSFYFGKINKTIRYLVYASEISKHLGLGRFALTKKYFQSYVLGHNQVQLNIPRSKMNVRKVYVYGDYWKKFHESQFGYCDNSQQIVGYPDISDIFYETFDELAEGVCYVAQTLVEDGRLEAKLQIEFFNKLLLETSNLGVPLSVKLHPRSNKELYAGADGFSHVTFYEGKFPIVSKYVGHYSTLLVKGMIISGDVCIYEYPKHPTPEYFVESSTYLVRNTDDLKEWLLSNNSIDSKYIKNYFELTPNTYRIVAKDIHDVISSIKGALAQVNRSSITGHVTKEQS